MTASQPFNPSLYKCQWVSAFAEFFILYPDVWVSICLMYTDAKVPLEPNTWITKHWEDAHGWLFIQYLALWKDSEVLIIKSRNGEGWQVVEGNSASPRSVCILNVSEHFYWTSVLLALTSPITKSQTRLTMRPRWNHSCWVWVKLRFYLMQPGPEDERAREMVFQGDYWARLEKSNAIIINKAKG